MDIKGSKMRVLVVEDNDFSAELISSAIERYQVDIVRAKNGDEALELFKSSAVGEISVIFMDIIMQGMRGDDAAKLIRGLDREDAKTVKIYAATAWHQMETQSDLKDFNGIIKKPFDQEELKNVFESMGE